MIFSRRPGQQRVASVCTCVQRRAVHTLRAQIILADAETPMYHSRKFYCAYRGDRSTVVRAYFPRCCYFRSSDHGGSRAGRWNVRGRPGRRHPLSTRGTCARRTHDSTGFHRKPGRFTTVRFHRNFPCSQRDTVDLELETCFQGELIPR